MLAVGPDLIVAQHPTPHVALLNRSHTFFFSDRPVYVPRQFRVDSAGGGAITDGRYGMINDELDKQDRGPRNGKSADVLYGLVTMVGES